MGLCLYFLPVLKGEMDIVGAVDSGVTHQRVPVFQLELGECVRKGLEALKEGFNVGSLGLHPIQLTITVSRRYFAVSKRCVRPS